MSRPKTDAIGQDLALAGAAVSKALRNLAVAFAKIEEMQRTLGNALERLEKLERWAGDSPSRRMTRPVAVVGRGGSDPWSSEMIAALRRSYGFTLKEMSQLLQCVPQSVHNWERGVPPKQEALRRLSEAKKIGKRRAWKLIGKVRG